ncbi:MAG: HAMP domain-containing protein [Clostridia bacterium]|nr:HAMP domain-containing protein [Clostridia bacterium]
MYRNLHYKIILIFVVFTITLMTAIGAILVSSAYSFYNKDFLDQMNDALSPDGALCAELREALGGEDFATRQKEILRSYSGQLGISKYRNYYILDAGGVYLEGSDARLGASLEITANMIAAMAGNYGTEKQFHTDYIDYAVPLVGEEHACIIYIKDLQNEARSFSIMVFQIALQALFIGLAIAVLLSFFLAKAITAPIGRLTEGAQRIAHGKFEEEIENRSDDEIGILTTAFNHMKNVLKDTMDEITGERQKFETLFLYLNEAVVVYNNAGKLMHINRTARSLFRTDGDGMFSDGTTLNFSRMLRSMGLDYREISEKYKENSSHIVHDVMFDEQVVDVNFAEFRYFERNEEMHGIMCVIHDNTSHYELDKARREFVADISHELRTPLTGIKGALETIIEYPMLDQEIRDNFLNMAVEECDRMTRIVSDLLVLSRLDNKRTAWKIETFSPSKFLDHIYDVMSVEAKKRSQTFTRTYPMDMPEITGDREKLQQVLINVVSNAMKYTADGGTVSITATPAKKGIAICVADNGMGIPKEDLPRLFERFYRVEKARSSDAGGSGLGLAIAKEILDAHGGEIRVESAVGRGTSVFVTLPYISILTEEKA